MRLFLTTWSMYRYSFTKNKSQVAFSNCFLVWYVDQFAIFNIALSYARKAIFLLRTRTRCPGHLIGQFLYKRIHITNGTQQNHIMYPLWDIMKIVRYHIWYFDTLPEKEFINAENFISWEWNVILKTNKSRSLLFLKTFICN